MELTIGQKVAYPTQGVCLVEGIDSRNIGNSSISFYSLRVLSDNSIIFVPTCNTEAVGIRPVISAQQYQKLIDFLGTDFSEIDSDWKVRSREFAVKLQSGDVFEAADVLKKLTFLSHEKKLSFREQSFLEKARFLIVSEVTDGELASEEGIAGKIEDLLACACKKHEIIQPRVMTATGH
jgi:CarD family transcriptional regulator